MQKQLLGLSVTLLFLWPVVSLAEVTPLPTKAVCVGKTRFPAIKLADTPEAREKGLMECTRLPIGHGMLFRFPQPEPAIFWMRRTRIPLDMVFIRRGRIVNIIQQAQPCPDSQPQCPLYRSEGPVNWVLEIPAGLAAGFKRGERVFFCQ